MGYEEGGTISGVRGVRGDLLGIGSATVHPVAT